MRAPGEAPGMMALEVAIDEMAEKLGMDPIEFRIANDTQVDPENPERVYLRVLEPAGETLAVTQDGGQTFARPVHVDGILTAFARLASGMVLVGAVTAGRGEAFRSTDGGVTFDPWPNPPRLRALAERDGKLFAAGDNFKDGFAVAVSTDEGRSLTPLMAFDQVTRIKPCSEATCQDDCNSQAGINLWSPEVCEPGGRRDAGGDAPVVSPRPGTCGCDAAGDAAPTASAFGLGLAVALCLGSPSRRRLEARCRVTPQASRHPSDGG